MLQCGEEGLCGGGGGGGGGEVAFEFGFGAGGAEDELGTGLQTEFEDVGARQAGLLRQVVRDAGDAEAGDGLGQVFPQAGHPGRHLLHGVRA